MTNDLKNKLYQKFGFDNVISRKDTYSVKWDVVDGVLPMWVADMDFETSPAIKQALAKRVGNGAYGYTFVPDEWYAAVISWWKRRHGVEYQKEWLAFCTGAVPAISSAVRRLSNVGDNVLALTPCYNIFFNSIENAGRHALEHRLLYDGNRYDIDFDLLEKQLALPLTTVMILCNPQNPTGNIWSGDTLAKIGALCKKHGVAVISDEIHCDIVAPGEFYTPFIAASDDCKDVAVVCASATKAFNIAGLQSGVIVVPNKTLRAAVVRGINSDEVAEPNCFAIQAAVSAFNDGEEWLDAMREYVFENRKIAQQFVNDELAKYGVSLVESKATYLLWLDCGKLTNDSKDLANHILKTAKLMVSPGAIYRGNGNSFIRLNIACPRALLRDGLQRLKFACDSYSQKTPR